MRIKLNTEDIMRISLFEKMTGANVIDSTSDDEKIVFVVKEGDIGAAIGKGGENVKNATDKFGKKNRFN
jgi:N utilization substance protein A